MDCSNYKSHGIYLQYQGEKNNYVDNIISDKI